MPALLRFGKSLSLQKQRHNTKGSLKTNPSNKKTVWLNTERFCFFQAAFPPENVKMR